MLAAGFLSVRRSVPSLFVKFCFYSETIFVITLDINNVDEVK
jgi:hypothetical protein